MFSCPYSARSPHSPEPCLWRDQNFANSFEKGHPTNIPQKSFQNLTSSFGKEDFLRISSCPYSARNPHSPEPCLWMDQNTRTIFEKGHQRNIPVNLFQNLTNNFRKEDFLRISSCPYIVQEAPIHQSHVFWRIKISQTIFEKGYPRNIPAKLFQNLTSSFGEEDFLRISCPYSARSTHSPEPCLWTDQNFANSF